jgi:hypothetical protein
MLAAIMLACSESRPPAAPTGEPSPSAASIPGTELASSPAPDSSLTAPAPGIWAAAAQVEDQLGLALRLEPGPDPNVDEWRFIAGSWVISCKPQVTDSAWLFTECRDLPETLTAFAANLPFHGRSLDLRLTSRGKPLSTVLLPTPSRVEPQSSPDIELVWHRPVSARCGSNRGVWAEDGFVYAACATGGFEVLDGLSGELRSSQGINGTAFFEVVVRNGTLFAASTSEGVIAYDVSNPAAPRRIGQFKVSQGEGSPDSATNIHTLTLTPDGNVLFAVNQSHPRSDVRILDVGNPAAMAEISRYLPMNTGTSFGGGHDVYFEERGGRLLAYFHQLAGGFHILDVTDPGQPHEISQVLWNGIFSHSGWPFQVGDRFYYAHNDEGYGQGLTILDVTNPASPRIVATFKGRPGVSIHNIRVVDGIAYASYYVDGLRIIDLRDPANPREVAHYDTVPAEKESGLFQGAWGVDLDGGVIYVSDMNSGVYALRWSRMP